MMQRLTGYICMVAAVGIVVYVTYRNAPNADTPLIFSPTQLLEATWLRYKQTYVEPGTYRTVDKQRNDMTTSEGQGYTMLRAVWMGDKETFDGAWQWTRTSLERPHDHLFSWAWGQHVDGSYGVLTEMWGQNSASDADTDIAMALIFAFARWQDRAYLDAARGIAQDIWNHEVIFAAGVPYLAADNREAESPSYAVINPSYLNPAAYKLFAVIDPSHPWDQLASSSYDLLAKSMKPLPPDWLRIDKQTGEITAATSTASGIETTGAALSGYDALRVPFHLALDWEWSHDARDKTLLENVTPLLNEWHERNHIGAVYTQSGNVVDDTESAARYGASVGAFAVTDREAADGLYAQKLAFLYNPAASAWKHPLFYYEDNWAWFGIALYNHLLPNLAAHVPPRALTGI